MNIKKLEEKAKQVAPEWLIKEVSDFLEMVESEREYDPESWGDYWNFFEVLDHFESSDIGDERRFKLALTKIERHIGVQRQLRKGEEVMTCSYSGTKTLREGDWDFDKRWDELIEDKD